MQESSPENIEANKEDILAWEEEVDRLQMLKPVELQRNRVKQQEVPQLEKELEELEDSRPELVEEAEKVRDLMIISKFANFFRPIGDRLTRVPKGGDERNSNVEALCCDHLEAGTRGYACTAGCISN